MKFRQHFKMEEAGGPEGGTGTMLTEGAPATLAVEPVVQAVEAPEWLKGADAEYLESKSITSHKDINSLLKTYNHSQSMVGKNKMVIPDEYTTEDDWNDIYNKMGRPEREKYGVDFGESDFGDDFQALFLDTAHKNGVLPRQAQEMFNFMNGQINDATTAHEESVTTDMTAQLDGLKKEWGSGYEKEMSIARAAVDTLLSESDKQFLDSTKLGNHPQMIKMLNSMGKQLTEDSFSRDTVKHLGMTKDDAQQKINHMMGDSTGPYWNGKHINHTKAVADMQKYHEILSS